MVNFLGESHVLVELIQLGGRSGHNEVLAWFETNAKDFVYPTADMKPTNQSGQRDVFMMRGEGFPVNFHITLYTFSNKLFFQSLIYLNNSKSHILNNGFTL